MNFKFPTPTDWEKIHQRFRRRKYTRTVEEKWNKSSADFRSLYFKLCVEYNASISNRRVRRSKNLWLVTAVFTFYGGWWKLSLPRISLSLLDFFFRLPFSNPLIPPFYSFPFFTLFFAGIMKTEKGASIRLQPERVTDAQIPWRKNSQLSCEQRFKIFLPGCAGSPPKRMFYMNTTLSRLFLRHKNAIGRFSFSVGISRMKVAEWKRNFEILIRTSDNDEKRCLSKEFEDISRLLKHLIDILDDMGWKYLILKIFVRRI